MEEEQVEALYMTISSMLGIILTLSLFGDLLGINVFELAREIITKPWVIPEEIIRQYYPVWYGMEWLLLTVMLADQVYTMRYYQANKEYPPPEYTRWVALIIFICSFWLAILFRTFTFFLLTIYASLAFVYSFIRKREEET